ncbi:MAG: 2,3-bisphosphoglycerate-independent phosphoglycerate mutase [Tissierellia bacterium]|nr:2,3-bisphosphoglycerate-independent phosphoglycerate mutase [Tissierellia bacterium]
MPKTVLLAILDGLGLSHKKEGNAFYQANTPVLDQLMEGGYAQLEASGLAVGLPQGQMGNSEVGHLNIGAGRVVEQELVRISKAVERGDLLKNPVLLEALDHVEKEGSDLHIMGLLSKGGVHSHQDHLYGLLDFFRTKGFNRVYVHGFLDGRDVSPQAGKEDVRELVEKMEELGVGQLASLVGRYYAMDRDKRSERTLAAYDLHTLGLGIPMTDPVQAVINSYDLGILDEFLKPHIQLEEGQPLATIKDGDAIIFYNFRPDRARQLVRAYVDRDLEALDRSVVLENIYMATMVDYDPTIQPTHVLFEKEDLTDTLGQVVSQAGLRQLRIAETEKYPHVTFFLNGGREESFEGEDRILIPSPQVATYDLKPSMSALEVKNALVEALKEDKYDLVVLNMANPDMVGHTGDLYATIQAIETVDRCLGEILETLEEWGGEALITSDHGNSETMINDQGQVVTSHTTNPVMVLSTRGRDLEDGVLADLGPTILDLLGLDQPGAMTGHSLLK